MTNEEMNKIKPFKLKIINEEHSREVQEFLFSHGIPNYTSGYTHVLEFEVRDTSKRTYMLVYEARDGNHLDISYTSTTSTGVLDVHYSHLPEMFFWDGQLHDTPEPEVEPMTFREVTQLMLDGETIQVWYDGKWKNRETLPRMNVTDFDKPTVAAHRIKPQTKRYINGVELPECVKNPKQGSRYYYPSLRMKYCVVVDYDDSNYDVVKLEMLYETIEDAVAHYRALINYEIREV